MSVRPRPSDRDRFLSFPIPCFPLPYRQAPRRQPAAARRAPTSLLDLAAPRPATLLFSPLRRYFSSSPSLSLFVARRRAAELADPASWPPSRGCSGAPGRTSSPPRADRRRFSGFLLQTSVCWKIFIILDVVAASSRAAA
ncbi:hypothetical protein BRADI_4g32485v3 [Brachypodium distachyon]|uniref:Uncharacterized protein n=1 Tax=Brachypodium distachyon TaxID=15368 RepID=A0A0Q3EST3_BRADI|nr:hypothetical protein BRADI_4g32485v3 [Brachypodium distachyon]